MSPSGVGNSKTGVGPVFGEWMEWSCGYGVEIVVWEWGIRSGGVGVGRWCGSGRFYNATPITHMLHSNHTHSPTPLYPTPQSPTPPISNQSPINQIQQSAVTRIACQLLEAGRGVAKLEWAIINRYVPGVGRIPNGLPARYCMLCEIPTSH